MAARAELVQRLVLNWICDDYEDIEQIQKGVDRDAGECGMVVGLDEIVQALQELVSSGWAKAYWLHSNPPDEFEGMPPAEKIVPFGAYFWVTPEGMKVQLSDWEGWPFDEEGDLRKDWSAPVS